jgi:thiol-disulfide isomerase/thioredoxin
MSLHVGNACPPLDGATHWINKSVDAQTLSDTACIIVFWNISCPACMASFPSIEKWLNQYKHIGLNVVAIHSPRLPMDYDEERVRTAFLSKNLPIYCAIDNEAVLREKFQTQNIWPYYFLFDEKGELRSRAAGGIGIKLFENALQRLCSRIESQK